MNSKVICLTNGPLQTNTYLYFLQETLVVIIDPASRQVKDFVESNNLDVYAIFNTHGHFDHISGNIFFDVPVYVHKFDIPMLNNPELNFSSILGEPLVFNKDVLPIESDITIELEGMSFSVLYTPGHTLGSICILCGDVLFSGDTLFSGSIGRTDLPGGDYEQMQESIRKLMKLDDKVVVYPGHGDITTIGHERQTNPFYEAIS